MIELWIFTLDNDVNSRIDNDMKIKRPNSRVTGLSRAVDSSGTNNLPHYGHQQKSSVANPSFATRNFVGFWGYKPRVPLHSVETFRFLL